MLCTYILLSNEAEKQALISAVVAYATIFGVIASIIGVYIAFKRFRKEHEMKMATREYVDFEVGKVDARLENYINTHEGIHRVNDGRIADMHKMILVLYKKEMERNGKK